MFSVDSSAQFTNGLQTRLSRIHSISTPAAHDSDPATVVLHPKAQSCLAEMLGGDVNGALHSIAQLAYSAGALLITIAAVVAVAAALAAARGGNRPG